MTKRRNLSIVFAVLLAWVVLTVSLLALSSDVEILGLHVAHAQGSTLHVAPGGDCGGASPCYATIQAAVDAASNDDTIKVAQGTYTSTGFQVVYINKAITLTGGYIATDWANSYPITQPTVIDAEDVAGRRGVYIDGSSVATITLAGLTIQRGYVQDTNGGGIYIHNGTMVLRDSRVISNTAEGSYPKGMGGGVYVESSRFALSDNLFQSNSASQGGGVHAYRGTVTLSGNTFLSNSASSAGGGAHVKFGIVALCGNTFQSNSASSVGGGVYLELNFTVVATLTGNTFQSNSAGSGGGVRANQGTITLSSNTFLSNSASSAGGGMYAGESTLTLNANTFQSNSAGNGGGMYVYYYRPATVSGNTFLSNSASSAGGGVYLRLTHGVATLSSNTLQSNSAGSDGGGVYVSSGTITLDSNIIQDNTANQNGGGIAMGGGTVNAQNDIIADNTSSVEGIHLSGGTLTARHWTLANNGDYALTNNGGSAVLINTIVASHTVGSFLGLNIAADTTLFFNSVTSCGGGVLCANNIFGDPKFLNPAVGDYHIGPGSTAMGQGVDAGVTTDVDGDPRPICSGYDIGADQLMPSSPVASFTSSSPDWVVGHGTVMSNTTVVTGCAFYLWGFGDGASSTAISPTHAYTAPGIYTVVLTATNPAGTSVATDTVTLYAASFTSSSPHQPGQTTAFTNTTVTSGTTTYLWSFGDEVTSTLESPTHTYASPGSYTVVLTATNFAGFGVVSGAVVVDGTAPAGTTAINDNITYATSRSVILTLSASDGGSGVAQMQFSNDGSNWSTWETYATTESWTLTSGDGAKTVYVRYSDNAENTAVFSDTIVLDTTLPTGSISISDDATYANSTSVTLNLNGSDAGSGVAEMQFSNDGSNWSSWEGYATTKAWTLASGDGTKTVYVRYQDNAGNTAVFSDTIILDTTPPSAAVDPLTPYQTSLAFTVSWAGSDAGAGLSSFDVQVRDGDGPWTDWLTSTTVLSSTFAGSDGHTFYFRARARDMLGNVGTYASGDGDASSHVDTTRPEGGITINDGAIDTTSRDVLLVLTANGASEMAFSDDGVTFGSWESFASTLAYELPPGDGLKSVTVRYRDPAGNIVEYSDTITLDTSIPGAEGLSINDDDATTDQVTVTLTLKAPPGTRQMMVSNSSRFVAAAWEPYATTQTWVLAYDPYASVYHVYAQFRHADGTVSERYDDVITLHLIEPPPPVDVTPPSGSMVINAGASSTSVPTVTLDVLAADNPGGMGVQWMYFREWKYDPEVVQWVIVRSSGWLPYAESTTWSLAPGTGVKHVGAWFADGANNVSNPVVLDDINLIVPGDTIGEAEVAQYRRAFQPGRQVTVTLSVASGDADLYIWRHGSTAAPDYWSNLPGTATEQVMFTAVEGAYLIEVHGYASSEYTLDIATVGDSGGRGAQGMTVTQTVEELTSAASKPLPSQPLVTTKPGEAETPDEEPKQRIYLPLVVRSRS